MKGITFLLIKVATVAGGVVHMAAATGQADTEAVPIYGVKLPSGYRDWRLISVATVGGKFNDLRAKLGNDVAISAFREEKLPFPEGTIIASSI